MAEEDEFDLSDEDLWESITKEVTKSNAIVKDTDCSHQAQPYRLNFGSHEGKTLEEAPASYVAWLEGHETTFKRQDLREAFLVALKAYRDSQRARAQKAIAPAAKAQFLTQTISSPDPKPKPSHINVSAAPSFSKSLKLVSHTSALPENACSTSEVEDSSLDSCRIDFGKYAGKTPDELPSSYIDWLLNNGLDTSDPELATVLQEKSHSRLASWKEPLALATRDPRFFNGDSREPTYEPLWISAPEAQRYFQVSERLPVFPRPLPYVTTLFRGPNSRYSLYQVYAYAEHFRTVTKGTTDQALADFLNKNSEVNMAGSCAVQ